MTTRLKTTPSNLYWKVEVADPNAELFGNAFKVSSWLAGENKDGGKGTFYSTMDVSFDKKVFLDSVIMCYGRNFAIANFQMDPTLLKGIVGFGGKVRRIYFTAEARLLMLQHPDSPKYEDYMAHTNGQRYVLA